MFGGHVDVVADRREGVLVVAGAQAVEGGRRLGDAGAQVDGSLHQVVEGVGGVEQLRAHFAVAGDFGVEAVVCGAAGGDDLQQHGAAFGLGQGRAVVDALAQFEGAVEGALRVHQCRGQVADAGVAEFGAGQVEFGGGQADGLVGGDEFFAGEGVQGVGGQAVVGGHVVGPQRLALLDFGGDALLAVAARPRPGAAADGRGTGGARAEDPETVCGGGGGCFVDGGDGCAGPVVGAQCGHGGVGQVLAGGVGVAAGVAADVAVADGHGEHGEVRGAAECPPGLLGPLVGGRAVEGVHVDDAHHGALVLLELGGAFVDGCFLAVGEHVGGVPDPAVEALGRFGACGGRAER